MEKKKFSFNINTWLPVIIFILMVIIFAILTKGQLLTPYNIKSVINQTVATWIAGLGLIFVAAMGSTDITPGVVVALAGCFGLMAAEHGSVLFIIISILIGACSGLLLGFVNAKLKVNSFMACIACMMSYRALANLMLSNKSLYLPMNLMFIDNFTFKIIAVIILVCIITYIFNFTRFGNYVRGIGENEVAIRHTGVNVEAVKMAAFIIAGIMFGIAGIFTIARVGGTNNTMGIGFEMKVMMACFIGGVPVRGGEGSKIYKMLFGAPTITILESGLVQLGCSGGVTQLIRGLVLLGAVCLTSFLAKRMAYVGQTGAKNQKAVEVEAGVSIDINKK